MIDATPSHAVLREFFDNSSLTWGLMACGVAQLSKLFLELLLHRRWRPAVLIETGGMPSSHSALVTGTAACVGSVSYTHLRAHETRHDLVCRLLLEKKKKTRKLDKNSV